MCPFDDDEDDASPAKPVKGLGKVSSKQSSVAQNSQEKQERKNQFEQQVAQVEGNRSASMQNAQALALNFNKLMQDKTLHSNKTMFQADFEKSLIKDLLELSIELNNDEDEQEGIGSTALFSLVLKNCISTRDRLNKLEYDYQQLQMQFETLTNSLESDAKQKP